MYAWIIWLIALIAFLVIEAVTINLVTIWFAAGSLGAMIAALAGGSYLLQGILFLVISLLGFLLFIFVVKPRMGARRTQAVPTNADRIINQEAIVIKTIDPLAGVGQIQVCGQIWSATAEGERVIPAGSKVYVRAIKGVKAVVE